MASPILNPAARVPATTAQLPVRSRLDPVIFFGTFGLLLFGPLAFGSVEPWAIFVLELGAAGLFLLWCVRQAQSGEVVIFNNPVFVPMLVFAALIVLQLATGRTAYRYQTVSLGLLYCAYGLLGFLVVQVLRRTSQIKLLAVVLSIYGAGVAMFALIQSMASPTRLYGLRTPHFGGWIYGPYVNHNHYAGLMEMLVPIPLVLALTRFARGPRRILVAVAAAVMAGTIFLSGSRGGMAALTVQIAALGFLLNAKGRNRRAGVALGIFLVITVGLLAWLGGGELTKRLASIHSETRTELSGGIRMAINRDGLRMFARKPVLGWGLGTFPDVYPQFRSFYTNFFVNQAHDDYLQLLVEMGALGFATMLWFLAAVFRGAARKLGRWIDEVNGAVTLAALLGVLGILVHSFVDFNLQIPANAAVFYVLCTIAAMEPRFNPPRRKVARPRVRPEWLVSDALADEGTIPAQ
jgi:O-antigen ligase